MKFSLVADCYEKIEATTKRLEMTNHLVGLLQQTPSNIVDKVVYLTRGKLYPDFVDVQIGIAEKLAIQVVGKSTGQKEHVIVRKLAEIGDIGETTQIFLSKKVQATLFGNATLTVEKVYGVLDKIARASGSGSMDRKLRLLAGLLTSATPKEAKYIVRIVTGNLRLGIADMTVLDALAIAYGGGKDARDTLERAYNISSDLGRLAKLVAKKGLEGVARFEVSLGSPIRPMLAERLGSLEEILEKLHGNCVAEFKYDGERVQAHKKDDNVRLFSRRLENITDQYPDAKRLFQEKIGAKEAIVEAECVAVDSDTGEMKPFQELMHRRRKYGVEKAVEQYPITLFVFDVLFVDGKDYTLQPYLTRRERLEQIILESDCIKIAESQIVTNLEDIEHFFEKAVESGCEGLICKSISKDSFYQAGARGWNWIKYKREYKSEMIDTVDLVIVGAFYGRGRRTGTYGALLLAAYNQDSDGFETVTKCGTGFTDEDLAKLPKIMKKHRINHRHARVNSMLDADIWFEPAVVIEALGAEITLSPIHTCAMDVIRRGSGLAIRFPRFTGNYRLDKSAETSTSSTEIVKMYQSQMKKLSEN